MLLQKQKNGFIWDFILFGIITAVIMIGALVYLWVTGENQWGIVTNFLYAILGTILGALGAAIGNLVRKIFKPSTIEADNFVGYFNKHVFWAFGPQIIGGGAGIAITISLLESLLGVKL